MSLRRSARLENQKIQLHADVRQPQPHSVSASDIVLYTLGVTAPRRWSDVASHAQLMSMPPEILLMIVENVSR
jgi:hypothetical protein